MRHEDSAAAPFNNFWGIRKPGSLEYEHYATVDEGIRRYEGLLRGRYRSALSARTPEEFAAALKSRGYYEDSYANYARGMRRHLGEYGQWCTDWQFERACFGHHEC
jgi:flagellum-specific peptidoglycan hydrolase FlgJ